MSTFNLFLCYYIQNFIVQNGQCEGMVLDASLNYNIAKILLLCNENSRKVGWNNNLRKSNTSGIDNRIINFFNYIHELFYLLRPSYRLNRNRNQNDKIDSIRYHFIPNEAEREEKANGKNESSIFKLKIFF